MKKLLAVLMLAVIALSLAACAPAPDAPPSTPATPAPAAEPAAPTATPDTAQPTEPPAASQAPEPAPTESAGSNILVAYFTRAGVIDLTDVDAVSSASINADGDSYVGNCEIAAEMAAAATGADVFQIITEQLYPSEYRDTTDVAKEEQTANARPALTGHVQNMDAYDTVILVYPNWWGSLPMPLCTFLEEYDFTGKTIAPLCTHEGSGLSATESEIADLCPGAVLADGLAIRGGSISDTQGDVESWLSELGITG